MNSISDRELLENRDRVEQLRFTASVVGELIARNQIELVLGSDAAWKMIRELAEERHLAEYYRKQCDILRGQYEHLYKVVAETYGEQWETGPGKDFSDSI